ncbi:hypothetical protein [Salinirubrum litoreum]|uniref:Uncharacterized protein n=1 Tax=Salinirubrum litoreum TaxID=1126234 RepID=A0ABD5R5S9_9EURY|nr:hypothetical protein [Salinirubrum litoreum]
MPRIDDWHASAEAAPLHDDDPPATHETDDGVYYTVISELSGPAPATIERVYVPVSKAWSCDTELVTVTPRHVETGRRGGRRLTHFAGVTSGDGPNDRSWRVRVDVLADPLDGYHRAGLQLTETVDYVEFPPETLVTVAVG